MDIVVCIKQVPDTTEVQINEESKTIERDKAPAILNPFDLYALEEALRIKDSIGSGSVTAISMGPARAKSIIQEALSLGVDKGILISDKVFMGSDTWCTALILAAAIKKIKDWDLILCGKQAIDGDTAQVGPEIAEILGIPNVTYIKKITKVTEKTLETRRMIETGHEIVEIKLPGLLTVLKDINVPRLPSLNLMQKAMKTEIEIWNAADLGLDENEVGLKGSKTVVVETDVPVLKARGKMIEGSVREKAKKLVSSLVESANLKIFQESDAYENN